jgi:DHA2 family methylenomycin A resistance protein-like MFS transporter
MRQTGSVLGVALFGSLLGGSAGFLPSAKIALLIAAGLSLCALVAVMVGVPRKAD